jgi:predicted nucleotide-binding protein (sugar kinase/HSP70/actin superfamily)
MLVHLKILILKRIMDLKEPQIVITTKIYMKTAKIVTSQQILQSLLIGTIVSQNSKKSG